MVTASARVRVDWGWKTTVPSFRVTPPTMPRVYMARTASAAQASTWSISAKGTPAEAY